MHQVEVWKDIDGYCGRYQISNFGRVRTNDYNHTHEQRIMKIAKNHRGYHQICLTKNNRRKTHKIHRLVAIAFVDNPNNYNYVNHIDEDKDNNNASNLEWCTNEYNITYGSRTFKTSIEYAQYDLDGNLIRIWPSGKAIQESLGFDRRNIRRCCDGLRPNAYGFIWKRASGRGVHLTIK